MSTPNVFMVGLGNILLLYRYRDMSLYMVLDFGYRDIEIWQKWCCFLVLKTEIH